MNLFKESAKVRGFYDTPIWRINEPKPTYYDLFKWSNWGFSITIENAERVETENFAGTLNEDLFDTIEKKIYYIQGVFEDSNGIKANGDNLPVLNDNTIYFANSQPTVERCKKWINEIARYMLEGKTISTEENSEFLSLIGGAIVEHNIKYLIPICHSVKINPVVVKFIQNYK